MKINNKIFIGALLIFVLSFYLFAIYSASKARKEHKDRSFSGIIIEIRHIEGKRGLPDILINNQWISIDIDESNIDNYIQVGDSIVKESGTFIIEVYRKNEKGEWYVKNFY